jgi:hypothetical protein
MARLTSSICQRHRFAFSNERRRRMTLCSQLAGDRSKTLVLQNASSISWRVSQTGDCTPCDGRAFSGMARLNVPPHVADKVLNHQSGTISGIAAVYQRHEFLAERKVALESRGTHVMSLLEQKAA